MQIKTKIILLGSFVIICLVSFNISLAQNSNVETEGEVIDASLMEDNRTPEEKIKEIEANTELPAEVKKIIIEQIKNPQGKLDESNLPQTKCADYYKFQSVQISLGANLEKYVAGDTVELKGEIVNQNTYPVVGGNVFARVSRKNNNYTEEGNFIIDEFLIKEKIALKEGEAQELESSWNIPANIAGGDYRIDYFFSVGKKFNLGGLHFSNEVVIGATEFAVESDQKYYISFNRSETVVNGEKYKHIGNWPVFGSDEKVVIKQPILNSFDEQKEVKITYNLYRWDSLDKNDLKESRTEDISIAAESSTELEYTIAQMNDAVYYLQIIAESGDIKSIVNIRLISLQENIRLNYPAITKFPINKGDNFTLFSCFHNGSNINSKGRVEVILSDKDGTEVGKFSYVGVITAGMLAEKSEVKAKKDYEFLKLNAKAYDADDRITDEYEVVYDCKDFNNCQEKYLINSLGKLAPLGGLVKYLLIIFSVVIVFVFGVVINKALNNKK